MTNPSFWSFFLLVQSACHSLPDMALMHLDAADNMTSWTLYGLVLQAACIPTSDWSDFGCLQRGLEANFPAPPAANKHPDAMIPGCRHRMWATSWSRIASGRDGHHCKSNVLNRRQMPAGWPYLQISTDLLDCFRGHRLFEHPTPMQWDSTVVLDTLGGELLWEQFINRLYLVLYCINLYYYISIVSTGEKKNDVHICPPLGADDDLSGSRSVQSFASGDLCRLPEIRPCSANGRRRGGAGHCRWCQRQHLTGHNRSRLDMVWQNEADNRRQLSGYKSQSDIDWHCKHLCQWLNYGSMVPVVPLLPSTQAIPAAKDARSSRDRIATPFVKDLLLALRKRQPDHSCPIFILWNNWSSWIWINNDKSIINPMPVDSMAYPNLI